MAGGSKKIAVIGGGFVGLSSALSLQRAGHRVALLDRASAIACPAHSTSYGNAGTFAAYANVPVNKPGIVWDLPKMLTSPTSPLSIKPTPHLLRMIPWFAHFLRNCNPKAVEHTAMALGTLLMRAERGYDAIWEQASVDIDGAMGKYASGGQGHQSYSCRNGYLILQKSEAAMHASHASAELRRRGLGPDLRMEALTQDEVLELEPNLADDATAGGAWWFPDGWFLREPGALLKALSDGFEAAGGELRTGACASVTSICASPGSNGVRLCLEGDEVQGKRWLDADEVVVACGAHSAKLARSVGDWVPLDTERGHHVKFQPDSETLLTRAVCDPSQGFLMAPMAGGIRSAGTVELGGTESGITPARCCQLEKATTALFCKETHAALGNRVPGLDWVGFRPTMPDALPVLGRSSRNPKVIYAFGHQHVGWTLGGITGQIVAEIVDGKEPCVPLEPFSPNRFGVWRSGSASAVASEAWMRLRHMSG